MTATENLERPAELALDVGIGEDGPFPAVVTLVPMTPDNLRAPVGDSIPRLVLVRMGRQPMTR